MKALKQKKILNKIIALAAAFACVFSSCIVVRADEGERALQTWKQETKAGEAAAEEEIVKIYTAEDLLLLAKQCSLDEWSVGKTVFLEADIDLTGSGFTSIPIFGGTFDGQGHTVSGFFLGDSGDVRGFFRYVQEGGAVKNLTVEGNIAPEGHRDTTGGIVGNNSGKLTGCTFRGAVEGKNQVGGIAGINEAQGQLINCSFEGELSGEHYAGGIAGQNLGSIIQCSNRGSINTTEVKANVELSEVNLEKSLGQINSAENIPACTDIGGIAGASGGVVQGCKNYGDVGYEHLGYNVGGIVGRQSGYLDGCVNEGRVRGRKDVGGIAGQFEPDMMLQYNSDTLNDLWNELEVMQKLLDTTIKDAKGASGSISQSMQNLSDSTKNMQNAAGDLTDSLTGWADENLEKINDFSARISWSLDQLEPAADSFQDALGLIGAASGQLSEALKEGKTGIQLGAEATGKVSDSLDGFGDAAAAAYDAAVHMSEEVGHLREAIGDSSELKAALGEMADGCKDMGNAFRKMSDSLQQARDAIKGNEDLEKLDGTLEQFQNACGNFAEALDELEAALRKVTPKEDGTEGTGQLLYAAEAVSAAGQQLKTSARAVSAALTLSDMDDITAKEEAYGKLEKQQTELEQALNNVKKLIAACGQSEDPSLAQLQEGLQELLKRTENIRAAYDALEGVLDTDTDAAIKEEIADAKETLYSLENTAGALLQKAADDGLISPDGDQEPGGNEEPSEENGGISEGEDDANPEEEDGAVSAKEDAHYFTQEFSLTAAAQGGGVSAAGDNAVYEQDETSKASLDEEKTDADPSKEGTDENPAQGEADEEPVQGETGAGSGREETGEDPSGEEAGEDSGKEETGEDPSGEETGEDPAKEETGPDPSGDETDTDPSGETASGWEAAEEDMENAVNSLRTSLDILGDALDKIEEAGSHGANMVGILSEVSATMKESFQSLAKGAAKIRETLAELADKPAIQFTPINARTAQQKDALHAALGDMTGRMDELNDTMTVSSDVLLSDMEAINRQFGVIIRLLQKSSEEEKTAVEDRFEDVSDESEEREDGRISGSLNAGVIEGDINVAGIAGAMAVEYDFDPEDDLVKYGDTSLDFSWQTSAVLTGCINTGEVTAKKDYAGGIVGRMDLGKVSGCESYGPVASSDGSYVGGIAGASDAIIRDSWAKCSLSGMDYIGGIAGLGSTITGCRSLIEVEEGSACLGTIAGQLEEDGTIEGNTYVHDTLAAVDNISYAHRAEPVSFDTMLADSAVPEKFRQFELIFMADEEVVEVVSFQYGKGITKLPEIPAKEGYTAKWPDIDYSCLTFGRTLEAEYVPYESALASAGEIPQILVDGSFSSGAAIAYESEEMTILDENGKEHAGISVTVRVEDPVLEEVSYTVHYRLPDAGKKYRLWLKKENGWEKTAYDMDGTYLLLEHDGEEVTFLLEEYSTVWIIVAIAAAAAVLLISLLILRKNRRKK